MGRAVMVGWGATGAGGLLPILLILTTGSCGAQKGWWPATRTRGQAGVTPDVQARVRRYRRARGRVLAAAGYGTRSSARFPAFAAARPAVFRSAR